MPEPVRIIPLGGLGEVGKNMTAFELGGRMILVDAGLSFPRSELLGIDLVLPDFSYIAEHADVLDAVILTHGHEDHIGALPYLFREIGTQAEVWGTRLTLGLVKSKLDEHGLLAHTELAEEVRQRADVVLVAVGQDDRVEDVGVLGDVGEVREHEVDPEQLGARERQARVDEDHAAAVLEGCHVLAHLAQPAQRDDPDRLSHSGAREDA